MDTMGLRFLSCFFCLFVVSVLYHTAFADQKPIRIGYLQNDIHQLACWVAIEKGFYRAEDLDVQVAGIFKAGPEEMSAFAARALDMGYVGEAPATTAVANGVARVSVVAQVNTEGSGLMVGKNSAVHHVKDLVGKIVAVPGHSTVQDFLLKKAFLKSEVDQKSVRIIVLKPPEMIGASGTDQISAFIAWEPYPAKAITMGAGRLLLSSRDIWRDHPCCVLVADDRFIAERPDDVRAMVRVHVRATDYLNADTGEALRIAVKYTGMDDETLRLAMRNVRYTYEISREGELEYVRFLSGLRYINVSDPESFVNRFLQGVFLKEITGR